MMILLWWCEEVGHFGIFEVGACVGVRCGGISGTACRIGCGGRVFLLQGAYVIQDRYSVSAVELESVVIITVVVIGGGGSVEVFFGGNGGAVFPCALLLFSSVEE